MKEQYVQIYGIYSLIFLYSLISTSASYFVQNTILLLLANKYTKDESS